MTPPVVNDDAKDTDQVFWNKKWNVSVGWTSRRYDVWMF
jgi:hypothetical protein